MAVDLADPGFPDEDEAYPTCQACGELMTDVEHNPAEPDVGILRACTWFYCACGFNAELRALQRDGAWS